MLVADTGRQNVVCQGRFVGAPLTLEIEGDSYDTEPVR